MTQRHNVHVHVYILHQVYVCACGAGAGVLGSVRRSWGRGGAAVALGGAVALWRSCAHGSAVVWCVVVWLSRWLGGSGCVGRRSSVGRVGVVGA